MTDYTLDKYDFKKYLLDNLTDTRQEELIFWKKNIPMPVDLVYDIFERRGVLLSKYLNHIGAAYLHAFSLKEQEKDWISDFNLQPNNGNVARRDILIEEFNTYFEKSGVGELLLELSEFFLLENYKPKVEALADAICHEGRKYKRLYIPEKVREKIAGTFPDLLNHMSLSNWDMFSNVVADELKIYRMGFADAFTGIFNKLVEFILKNSYAGKRNYISAAGIRIIQNQNAFEPDAHIIYGTVSDGSIWEPVYSNAKTTFIFNDKHPFCDQIRKNPETEQVIGQLVKVMSERENQIIRDVDKKNIEIFRQDISRELRIIAEKNI